MAKSNPDAVKALREEGAKADRERLASLQKAFPEDAAFAMKAFGDGLSVEGAKALRHDELAPKLAAAEKENAELKAQVAGGKVNFSYDKKEGEGNQNDPAAKTDNVEAQAKKVWDGSTKLQQEFGGEFKTFLSDFKRNPDDYRS